MTTTDTIAALALAVAVVAAVAAIGSWRAARNANGAAQALSRIEQQRLHADLTPNFRCTVVANQARSTAMLRVHLEGPPGLLSHHALEITTSLRNDNPHRAMRPHSRAPRLPKRSAPTSGGPGSSARTAATTLAGRLPRSRWRSASGRGTP
ncbi:hypothetical protein [Streptomyces sp. NPDC008121]|uniref:hypothetical protein n=1 Tax=Streptomyces sp. NPDC008121 TaxID=3364809 RepID=UPI0036E58CC6